MTRVACYGASGYTGRLAAEALRERGVDVLLAGRDRGRLEDARADVDPDAEIGVADADDVPALVDLLDDVDAVVDTAGPFLKVGDGPARAAVEAGVPYVDSTGEQVFAKQLWDDLDEPARDADVALVPMLAFEYALGDLGADLLLDGRPAERLDVAYKIDHGVATAGTRKSTLTVAARTGYAYLDGRLVEESPAEAMRTVPFDDRDLSAYSFPGGEVLTVPAHQDVTTVRTYMVAHPDTIERLRNWGDLARTVLQSPLGDLARGLVDLRHDDPTPDERGRSKGRVHLEARLDGDREHLELTCLDPYALTAQLLAEGSLRLAKDPSGVAGVVAPAEAFDTGAFLEDAQDVHESLSWSFGDGG